MSPAWQPTTALRRGVVAGLLGLGMALLGGGPVLVVLVVPVLAVSVLGLLRRPRSGPPVVQPRLEPPMVPEGQSAMLRLDVVDPGPGEAEHLVARCDTPRLLLSDPPGGWCGRWLSGVAEGASAATLVLEPRRWGTAEVSAQVSLLSAWGGFLAGPTTVGDRVLRVLPTAPAYDSRAVLAAAGRTGGGAPRASQRQRAGAGRGATVPAR